MKEQCPGELLRTDRGKFLWEPVPHGMVSTLPCPYGMSTNYTEHLEQLAHDSTLELKYADTIENSESARLFKNPDKGNGDHVKSLSSVGLRADPVKLHAHLKDIEYKQAHEMSVSNQQKDRELKLRIDEKGQPFAVRSCIRHKDGSVKWSNMDESICRDEHSTNAEQLSLELQQLTKDPPQISVQVFLNASSQIKQILHYALVDRKIARIMFSVISNMMAVNDTVLEEADKHGSITKSLVQLIDTYLTAAQLPSSRRLVINSDNLAMEAREVFPDEFRAIQDGLSYSPPETMNMDSGLVSETGEITQGIFISIPREALDRALRQLRSVRVQFVSYKNSKFFRPNNITSSSIISKRQGVISAALSNITITNLTELLVYNFHNIYRNAKQICVYWNTESQEWLDDGILTNQSMDFIQCESMHMTAFSVLLDPSVGMPIPDKHKPVLSIISYIGSVCSIFGLFLTILTYSIFRCLNRDRSGKILLNLCISLLLMNLAFLLVAIEEYMDSSLLIVVDVCTGVAVLTHYLVLTSLMWMLVEAINMYQLLITVFATSETKFMCKRMLCAWGIPLLIVGGAAIYDMQYYSSTDSEYCMVSPSKPILYYVTYLGPSCLILAVNCIVFILVSKVLFQRRGHGHAVGKVGLNTDIPTITVAQIRGAFTVMTLLGVTWVFGALALGETRLVFQYIFCISNSLQGFIIFMVRCVQYPEARMAWLTFLHTGKLKKHRGPQGHGLPSSSAGNSHSRHTISSSTQSQSQLQGTAHLRSQSQSHIQSRLRSSHTGTPRKTSLPESSSYMSNSSGSGQGSLWNRFRQHDSYHKTDTHVRSNWSFRSIFGSAHIPDSKQKPNSNSQNESEKGEKKLEGMMDGVFSHAIPLSDTLTRELKQSAEERSSDLHLSQPVCCDPGVAQPSETDGVSGDLKQGDTIRCRASQEQEKHTCGSQQSLTAKEGEDTSWQFMRAPPDGMSESKATAVAESHTTSHSHSDQGYMSGACTAEHSPESPRQEPKQSLSCTVVSPIQPDTCHHDQRLTVSTPDHLYPDPKEETVDGYHNNMLTKSDSDITILLPKQDDDSRSPAKYVAIKDDMVYTNSLMAQPSLVYEKHTVSSGIQHSGAGGDLIMESGLYSGGTNRERQELHCMDHPPQPRPGYSSRRSSSTKSYSSSEGNNAGSSSSGSLHSESNSLEMAPRTMQLSAHRRPIHLHRHTKRIRCEEVL
ncbi:hypothetical protein B7P43_G11234 [Cryptotermes secundus]|nr:hypothetical protein B7P43_G11234 [Cryptotermes secundus]